MLQTNSFQYFLQLLIPSFILLVFLCSLILLRKLLSIYFSFREDSVYLELTPPASSEKTSFSTQQLFSVIYNLGKQRSMIKKLLGIQNVFSCEIVSSQDSGIRYIVKTTPQHAVNLQRSIISYLPGVRVTIIDDYFNLTKKVNHGTLKKVVDYHLTRPFALPLRKQDTLEEHDPVAYITGMMTKLSPGEIISFQLVLTPVTPREVGRIKQKILRNDDILSYINSSSLVHSFFPFTVLFALVSSLVQVFQWTLSTLVQDFSSSGRSNSPYKNSASGELNRKVSQSEMEFIRTVESKIDQPLFDVRMRLFLSLHSQKDLHQRQDGFISSLGVYSYPNSQAIKINTLSSFNMFQGIYQALFRKRILSLFTQRNNILSVSEISDIYHFPFMRVTQTENVVKVYSKQLPAPLSLKNASTLDVTFAQNIYAGTTTPIGLTLEERKRHMYVIGATGSGKTTLLTSMITHDIRSGNGVCVVDPHGDLAESLLYTVPEERLGDLIYFNPYDIKYPIGLNLLELTPGLEEDDALLEKEIITESVISLFRKVFSDAMASHPHRIEYILRNTIHTAFTTENPTLFTIFELLNNPPFQKEVVQKLTDEHLLNFWKYEFGKAGDFQKVKMVSPVTARIGRFLFSPSAKRILEQPKSTINFDQIMDNKKILICNLSKGNLGEDTSEVMGIMILNKIQLASLKRARTETHLRNQYYLYVDEFQNFATPSFVQMMSEARKYGVNLIIAEQSTSQQHDKSLTHTILANVGTVACFRSANPQDEELMLKQFSPYVASGDITNLPAFNFYMKISAINPEEPFSGKTIVTPIDKDAKLREVLVGTSRRNNAIRYEKKASVITAKIKKKKPELTVEPSAATLFPES